MQHTKIAMNRPVTTVMVFVALSLVGVISSRLIPLESMPDISFPGFFMQIPYPGSTPEEVERRITRPIEEVIATLPNVKRMGSTSFQSSAQIGVFLGWDTDAAAVGIEARNKIDAIRDQLPEDLQRVFLFTGSLSDQPIITLRVSSDRDLSRAYEMLQRNVVRRLQRLEGVSRVDLQGVERPEIRIQLDPDRLAAHNVDINALRQTLRQANFSVSAGRITDGDQRFAVRPQGELGSVQEVENIIVDGANLRLRDVAEVRLREGERNYGRLLDRKYAVGLDIFKTTEANLVEVADRVVEELDHIGDLPQMRGVKIFVLESPAEGVKNSLNDLLTSGLIGALLAILVLYLFLRQLMTTLIVTLSVPFSLLITLGALYFFGYTLNILTMMGLMLAIGMLVDNAVVVTESIFTHRNNHPDLDRFEGTYEGVRQVGIAVMAGTLTSAAVFLPMVFGEKVNLIVFLQHVAVTIVVALLASLVISQTLVPMLAARIKAPPAVKEGSVMGRLSRGYRRVLSWTLQHHWKTGGIMLATLIIGIVPIAGGLVEMDPFPNDPDRSLFLPYNIEGSYSLDEVQSVVEEVEEYLFANQEEFEILSVYSYFDDSPRAQSTILLKTDDERQKSPKLIQDMIEEGLPEIIIGKPSFQREQQGGAEGFTIQLSGDSTERLIGLSEEAVRILSTIPGLINVRSDTTAGEQEVRIIVDRARAEQVGLTTQMVAGAVATAMRGENLREMRTDIGEVAVKLAYSDDDRQRLEDLEQLPLYTPNGERVLLTTIADLQLARGTLPIRRVDRVTAATLSADLDGRSMDDVRPEVKALMDQMDLPPGYRWQFGRGFQFNDDSFSLILTNILLGVVMIYLVMAALFESMLYPISIITSIAFSILGVFLFFAVTGTTFTFMASIGILILIGVVVNNGIVLVDHLNNLRREGMARDEAIIQAGQDRLRPILMTVATTILGLLPLAMGDTKVGGDGPPYYPMARAIIGGLAFSTVTSLIFVPSFYVWFDRLSKAFIRSLNLALARLRMPWERTAW